MHSVFRFDLAKFCTNVAHAAHIDVLVALGLNIEANRAKMNEWNVAGKSITLRMASKEFCAFVRESEHTVESPKVKTTTKVLGMKSTQETSIVTTVKDYFYKVKYDLHECSLREAIKMLVWS